MEARGQGFQYHKKKPSIDIVAPLWKEINALHFLVTHKYNIEGLMASQEEQEKITKEITERVDSAILNVRATKFWLGRELYDKQMEYIARARDLRDKVSKFQEAFKTGREIGATGEEMKNAADRAASACLDIDDVLKILTHGSVLAQP